MNSQKIKKQLSDFTARLVGRRIAYSLRYYHNFGCWPDLKHPKNLCEILISRIISDEINKYARYADKVKVREYVKEKGLEDHLLKHYHYWDDANKITKESLPDKFVLKTSNGAGGKNIFICRDKNKFDLEDAKIHLSQGLARKTYYERQYNVYQPYVICEELIDTGSDALPIDYKFTCIHGTPVDITIITGREPGVKLCTKNLDWSDLPKIKPIWLPSVPPEKPKHLDEMIAIAKILSEDFDFVRVDLYEYNDKVYFGELTFSPVGGILYPYTDKAIEEYGRLLRENK